MNPRRFTNGHQVRAFLRGHQVIGRLQVRRVWVPRGTYLRWRLDEAHERAWTWSVCCEHAMVERVEHWLLGEGTAGGWSLHYYTSVPPYLVRKEGR